MRRQTVREKLSDADFDQFDFGQSDADEATQAAQYERPAAKVFRGPAPTVHTSDGAASRPVRDHYEESARRAAMGVAEDAYTGGNGVKMQDEVPRGEKKVKSRFAMKMEMEREKGRAEKPTEGNGVGGGNHFKGERFTIDLDPSDASNPPPPPHIPSDQPDPRTAQAQPHMVRDVLERSIPTDAVTPPSMPSPSNPSRGLPSRFARRSKEAGGFSMSLMTERRPLTRPSNPPPVRDDLWTHCASRASWEPAHDGPERSQEDPGDPLFSAAVHAEISAENDAALASMTEEEILEEQRMWKEKLGSGLVEMLMSRAHGNGGEPGEKGRTRRSVVERGDVVDDTMFGQEERGRSVSRSPPPHSPTSHQIAPKASIMTSSISSLSSVSSSSPPRDGDGPKRPRPSRKKSLRFASKSPEIIPAPAPTLPSMESGLGLSLSALPPAVIDPPSSSKVYPPPPPRADVPSPTMSTSSLPSPYIRTPTSTEFHLPHRLDASKLRSALVRSQSGSGSGSDDGHASTTPANTPPPRGSGAGMGFGWLRLTESPAPLTKKKDQTNGVHGEVDRHPKGGRDGSAEDSAGVKPNGDSRKDDVDRSAVTVGADEVQRLGQQDSRHNHWEFDLRGRPLLASHSESEAHDEDHHDHTHRHGDGSSFSLPALLTLSQSSVQAQRSTGWHLLSRIWARLKSGEFPPEVERSARNAEDEVLKRSTFAMRDRNIGTAAAALDTVQNVLLSHLDANEDHQTPSPSPTIETAIGSFIEYDKEVGSSLTLSFFARVVRQGAMPDESLDSILRIIQSLCRLSRKAAGDVVRERGLLEAISRRWIELTWPAAITHVGTSRLSSVRAVELLTFVSRLSRAHAQNILSRGLADSVLRYLAFPPWKYDEEGAEEADLRRLAFSMLKGTLELWTVLARYGLHCGIRAEADGLLREAETYIVESIDYVVARSQGDVRPTKFHDVASDLELSRYWFELLAAWTVAAIDPHQTEPEHSILWTQVEGYAEALIRPVTALLDVYVHGISPCPQIHLEAVASAIEFYGAWVKGVGVNAPRRGEATKCVFIERFAENPDGQGSPIRRLADQLVALISDDARQDSPRILASRFRAVTAIFRLQNLLSVDLDDKEYDVLALAPATRELAFAVDRSSSFLRDGKARSGPVIYHLQDFLFVALQSVRRSNTIEPTTRLLLALDVLGSLYTGFERIALSVLDLCLGFLQSEQGISLLRENASDAKGIVDLPSINVLKPFFRHSILAEVTDPHDSRFKTDEQKLPSISSLAPSRLNQRLLAADWLTSGVKELLRSGQSDVFENVPADWEHSEVEIVKISLAFALLVKGLLTKESDDAFRSSRESMGPEQVYLDLMKVFLLEKDADSARAQFDSSTEVFRDEDVSRLISLSLSPLTHKHVRSSSNRATDTASSGSNRAPPSLVTPQDYLDFIALYDAVSFSHYSFAQLLLPPLSMLHSPDFRRTLWIDHSHLLKTIRVTIEDAPTAIQGVSGESVEGLRAFVYPLETDRPLLASYMRSIASGTVTRSGQEFLYFLALHHTASSLWDSPEGVYRNDVRVMAQTILPVASDEVLMDIMSYRQTDTGSRVQTLPDCFDKAEARARLELIAGWPESLRSRVTRLLAVV